MITKAQKNLIEVLCGKLKIPIPEISDGKEAQALIARLKKQNGDNRPWSGNLFKRK